MVSKTDIVEKEDLLHKFVAEDVTRNKRITVAVQIFIHYEQELDISNQIIKGYENHIGEKFFLKKNNLMDKDSGDNVLQDISFEKDEVFRKNSIKSLLKF